MTIRVYIDDVVTAARGILDTVDIEALRASVPERVALAVAVIHQHEMIMAAGLRYARPRIDEADLGTGGRSAAP